MGLATYTYNRSTSGGEIIRELVNASDGQGLHFDGAAGNIDIASPPDLGTKFSFEFILQADAWEATGTSGSFLIDFYSVGNRFYLANVANYSSYNLGIIDNGSIVNFGVSVLDDLKVHHLVMTVDGTTAKLYDNGNQVGNTLTISASHDIDDSTALKIGIDYAANSQWAFDGTIYRARLWNKSLSQAEVKATYENATVPFADQYGSQTELTSGWTNGGHVGGNPFETFTSSGTTISSAINTTGLGICHSAVTLTGGKKYRIEQTQTLNSGTSPSLKVGTDANLNSPILDELASSDSSFEFTATTSGTWYVGYRVETGVATNFAISGFSIVAAGCVADYDLAFSNPEISFMVQDRAGAADGEASNDGTNPTGISQVTPLVQVNATAARIGTSAATPADGELAVSGNVGVGGAPVSAAGVARFLYVGHSDHAGVVLDDTNAAPWEIYNVGGALYFSHNGTTSPLTISTTGLAVTGTLSSTGLATFSLGLNSTGNISPTINGLLDLGTSSLAWRKLYVNGIAFQSATTGSGTGTGYTLDSYEEGTFTASLTAATPPTSVPTTTGNYTRIGNIVKIQIRFENADTSGASGEMKVTGLPFTAANNNVSNYDPINAIFFELPFSSSESMIVKNTTEVRFYNVINDAAWGTYNISAGTGKYLFLNGTYTV